MNVYRSKPLTSANFKNDHIYITPFRDRLPVEVIGGTTRHAPAARFVQIEHDGSIIETYIPTNNGTAGTFFQNRTFARSFFDKTGAALGDVVLFTEVAHLHFRLSLEKTAPIAVPGLTLRRTASAEEYATFLNDDATETELALLRAHALGGETSMGELAPAAGYSEFRPVNAAYGRLGRRLAEANGLTPLTRLNKTPIWFSVLAAWRDPQDASERDDDAVSPQTALFRSYLHPEVICGLHLAEHLSDAELSNALRKRAALANEPSPSANHLPEHESLTNALDPQTALEHAIAVMMAMTRRTAAQSNGQTVIRVVKNKELRVSDQALRTLLVDLIKKQGGRCALSRLPLQYHGAHDDDQMLVSLDRIDSDGHYEADNVQVVCRFVNRWKSDMPDAEFRRLMDIVQTAGRE